VFPSSRNMRGIRENNNGRRAFFSCSSRAPAGFRARNERHGNPILNFPDRFIASFLPQVSMSAMRDGR
jgi:hypothetical protein